MPEPISFVTRYDPPLIDRYKAAWLNEEVERAALGLSCVNPWQRPTGCKLLGGSVPTVVGHPRRHGLEPANG